MNPRTRVILILGAAALVIGVCVVAVPPLLPPIFQGTDSTPTFTPVRPTRTATPDPRPTSTKPGFKPTATSTLTPQVLAAPPLPSPFDMILYFTNGTCGGGDVSYSYTFTIDGTSLTLFQSDAGITTTGTYDPATGAFSTSADVGPGVETYGGTITFDGVTITVGGSYSWTPDGGETCTADISGTTTP